MSEEAISCVQAARGPLSPPTQSLSQSASQVQEKEVNMSQARVGQEAPGFEASAYFNGGFKNVRLSDYRGKWVILCFYPGDFTFV
jgi:hypothetical protein